MLSALTAAFPEGLRHEIRFPPAREGHRMEGSGLFVVNPPYGLEAECVALSHRFAALSKPAKRP
jgi:23S rRNA (adenine2030-N6)-methyltransferase